MTSGPAPGASLTHEEAEYESVWQAWSFVTPRRDPRPSSLDDSASVPAVDTPREHRGDPPPPAFRERGCDDMRHAMQHARVAQCLSLAELAQRVKCDASALAAYERGDDILGGDVIARIQRLLLDR